MRFLSLDLMAFGPFTGQVIDLSSGDPGLHVVYGHNAAGKSTALRAITGLLYGIPQSTGDAHVHSMSDLRIGARIQASGGGELTVVRRKGRKNTLLGSDGKPLDESVLAHLLGGVGEALFRSMFGLNHVTLREGGNALLSGQGELGASLFDASLGGRGIHQLIVALEREADELFRPGGSKPALNAAINEFEAAKKQKNDKSVRPEAWLTQKRALDEARAERERLAAARTELVLEEQRLRRIQRARPLVVKRGSIVEERSSLGDVLLLPADSRERRERAEQALAGSARDLQRAERELARLLERRRVLDVPEALAALDEHRMEALRGRLGSERKNELDLPRRRTARDELEAQVKESLRRLGREDAPGDARTIVPGAALLAKVKSLMLEHQTLVTRLSDAEQELRERRVKRDAVSRELAALPAAPDSTLLERSVAGARKEGDIEARLSALESSLDRDRVLAEQRHRALGLWSGPLAELPALALPAEQTVDRFEALFADIGARRAQLSREREQLQHALEKCRQDVERLQRTGAVPTEAELEAARTRRDAGWRLVRRAWAQAGDVSAEAEVYDPERPLPEAFEHAQLGADQLADRLRREAERVEQMASLEAEQARARREIERTEGALGGLEQEQAAASHEWAEAWRPCGIEPRPPREMRAWLAGHADLSARVEQLASTQRQRDDLAARHRAHVAALEKALGTRGEASLAALIDLAAAELDRRAQIDRQHEQLRGSLVDLDAEIERSAGRVRTRQGELERWQSQWRDAIEPLGLGGGALPAEAGAVLDELAELKIRTEKLDDAARRVTSMERDAREFASEVEELIRGHAPALLELPVLDAAAEFLQLHAKARSDLERQTELDRDIETRRSECDGLRGEVEQAERELAGLLAAAGVTDLAALEAAEKRSGDARRLDQRLREVDAELLEVREGEPLEVLTEAVSGSDAATARGRLADIERELEELQEELGGVNQDIGGRERGLKEHLSDSAAADFAAVAEQQLARVEELAERYVRARLAVRVLKRELERYREENQGPIISRATELFPLLSNRGYRGLQIDFDDNDQAVLRCVRPDGTPVAIEALSDGNRDQLYLALRVASLERFSRHNEPLPVVLDDILVHFDNDCSRAALEVLADLSRTTQVLLFTHHEHLVDLAREAVGSGLFFHELDSAGRAA